MNPPPPINAKLKSWYTGQIQPGRSSPLELLMIQSTSFCNIDCQYCYLPLRSDKSRFDLSRLPLLIDKLNAAGLLDRELSIAWHAGEPLVLPWTYYDEAASILAAAAPTGVRVRHTFQTNAMLVTKAWCDFLVRVGANVGVSIDGPQDIHDARRMTRDGQGTFERGLAGYWRLHEAGLQPSLIAVLTAESLKEPDRMYQFFKSLKTREVGFNIEEIEGFNTSSSLAAGDAVNAVRRFFTRMLQLTEQDPEPLRIRELERARRMIGGSLLSDECHSTESNPLSIISVDTAGNISTFSPELLQVPGETSRYTFGNLDDIDFTTVLQSSRLATVHDAIRAGIAQCRGSCPYFSMCGGGAPANKLAEHGRFDVTETMYCRLSVQATIGAVETWHERRIQARRTHTNLASNARLEAATGRPATPTVTAAPQPIPVRAAAPPLRLTPARPPAGSPMLRLTPTPPGAGGPRLRAEPAARAAAIPLFPNGAPPLFSRAPAAPVPYAANGGVRFFCPPERLSASDGVREAVALGHDPRLFKPGALAPREPWRPLSETELAGLAARTGRGATNFVALVKLPRQVAALGSQLGRLSALSKLDRGKPTDDLAAMQASLAEGVLAHFAAGDNPRTLGIVVCDSGLPTLTTDLDDHLLWGLHVDSWFGGPTNGRCISPNRMGINIGTQPRRMQIIDLGLDEIAALLPDPPGAPPASPYDLGLRFMRAYPDYPVTALTIHPGEAYIAATENLIHDGNSMGLTDPDVLFTILGEFTPPST